MSFEWPVRVYWEDTDAGGIVFYANYLKFFERARTEWLRALGFSQQALRERSVPTRYHVIPGITHYGVYREGFEEATRVELEWFDRHLKTVAQ